MGQTTELWLREDSRKKKFLREKWAQVWLLQDLQYTYVQMYGQTDKLMHVCVIPQNTECMF